MITAVLTRSVLFLMFICAVPVSIWATKIDHSQLIEDARLGNSEAQYTLAHLLIKGRGGYEVDTESALAWFERAAARGHSDAAFDLAIIYLDGERVEKDNEQGLFWITRAAELGQVDAQYYLGLAYRKSSPDKAVLWLKKAESGGHVQAGEELQALCQAEVDRCD